MRVSFGEKNLECIVREYYTLYLHFLTLHEAWKSLHIQTMITDSLSCNTLFQRYRIR